MDKYGVRVKPKKDFQNSYRKAIQFATDLDDVYLYSKLKDAEIRKTLICQPIATEWKERLADNVWSVYYKNPNHFQTTYPKMAELRSRLLAFCGEDVCLNLSNDGLADADNLLECGQFWYGKSAKLMKGRDCRCHSNSAELYKINKDKFDIRICTGYALTEDGMWREHSWLVVAKPNSSQIIETTVKRIAYFGWVLSEEECDEAIKNWIW